MDFVYRNSNFEQMHELIEKFKNRTNPGMLLLLVAVVTMIIANSPLRNWYESLWTFDFFLGVGDFNLLSHDGHPLSLLRLINDGIMAIFFFYVGLEIKREVLVGELSSFRQALLPIIAALGGMIIPVLFFYFSGTFQNLSPDEMRGMAIPMATDIAFSLGVLSLFGKRAPLSLKIFLMTLAIADDIGGIIVIAAFYSEFTMSSLHYLGIALGFFVLLFIGNRLRVNNKLFYLVIGIIVWYLFLQAGIHPTIAGVLIAFTIPARPYINLKKFTRGLRKDLDVIDTTVRAQESESILLTNTQVEYLARIEAASDHVISPLQNIEDSLRDLVNYIIMPLFAFANAGVVFDLSHFTLFTGVSLSIILSLVLGKMIGIFLFTWTAIRLRVSRMPNGMNWSNLLGLSLLGGIGFTVALFLAGLSYPLGSQLLNNAKLGIIFGSLIAGALGYIVLHLTLKKPKKQAKAPLDHNKQP